MRYRAEGIVGRTKAANLLMSSADFRAAVTVLRSVEGRTAFNVLRRGLTLLLGVGIAGLPNVIVFTEHVDLALLVAATGRFETRV